MIFRRAVLADLDAIIDIIQKRIDWMDAVGLEQWNKTDYMTCYPRSYFEKNIGFFHVAQGENGALRAVMAAYTEDPRWPVHKKAYYIHHLATLPGETRLGKQMIAYAERIARRDGMPAVRLDSAVDNARLTEYYESMGYAPVGTCVDGMYEGILREKPVENCGSEESL